MVISLADQLDECWDMHAADEVHAETLAAELADLQGTAEVLADMERLDQEAAHERDVALLERARHPGDSVVHLN